jgi:hypothetical protein
MTPIKQDELIDGLEYYVESHGPNGLIAKYKGTYGGADGNILLRFNNVINCADGDQIPDSWFHVPKDTVNQTTENNNVSYYWKYFIPADKVVKQKVKLYDTKILLTKMLLIRGQYSKRIGDSSTIRGLIHGRYGIKK